MSNPGLVPVIQPGGSLQASKNWIRDQHALNHHLGDTLNPILLTDPFARLVDAPQGLSELWGCFPFAWIHVLWSCVRRVLSPLARILTLEGTNTHQSPSSCSSTGLDEDIRRLFNAKPAALNRDVESFEPPPSLTIGTPSAHRLPVPDQMWDVLSSWAIRSPIRNTIPRAYADTPKDKADLMYIEMYRSSTEKQYLTVSEELLAAEQLLNKLELDETTLLLNIEQLQPGSLKLESSVALAVARATRKSLNARKKVTDVQLAQAKLNVQRLVDAAEQASAMALEADHQLYFILSAFRLAGWSIEELPAYSSEALIFPSPPTLSMLKTIQNNYPYLSGSVKSLSARSSESECLSF